MGDEFKDVGVGEPITLSVEATGISSEALDILTGGALTRPKPEVAVVIDTVETVSGRPRYPALPWDESLHWWEFRKRGRINAERERLIRRWELDCRDWEAAGRPDLEVVVRRYLPNAQITEA